MALEPAPPDPIEESGFIDWALLGVDGDGEPVHRPTIFDGSIICHCTVDHCQLDRALYRARVVGFLQAFEVMRGEIDVPTVLGETP